MYIIAQGGMNVISDCARCLYLACKAHIGSISVTMTMAPKPFNADDTPFPTCKIQI